MNDVSLEEISRLNLLGRAAAGFHLALTINTLLHEQTFLTPMNASDTLHKIKTATMNGIISNPTFQAFTGEEREQF